MGIYLSGNIYVYKLKRIKWFFLKIHLYIFLSFTYNYFHYFLNFQRNLNRVLYFLSSVYFRYRVIYSFILLSHAEYLKTVQLLKRSLKRQPVLPQTSHYPVLSLIKEKLCMRVLYYKCRSSTEQQWAILDSKHKIRVDNHYQSW